jgi:hypothetical protein
MQPDGVRLYQEERPVQIEGFRQETILLAVQERVNETLDPVA